MGGIHQIAVKYTTMNINVIAAAFNQEVPKSEKCNASVENGNLVVRGSEGEKIIVMSGKGVIVTLPAHASTRVKISKDLVLLLRFRYYNIE